MKKLAMPAYLVQSIRIIQISLIGLAALSLAGCIQVHSDTTIEKDGSGTASLTMSMSPSVMEAIKEMKDMGMDQDQDMDVPMFEDINKEDLEKAAEGRGVKITKFEKGLVDGREQLEVVIDFEDLESLSYVMGSLMGGELGDGMGIYETADGNFVLKQAHYDFPAEPVEEIEPVEETKPEAGSEGSEGTPTMTEEEKAQKQMAIMGQMMGAMAELDVKFTITVPGEIIESNAPVVEGTTSIWAINASNMMNQQDQDMEPVITFSSKGLKIKALKE